MKQVDFPLNNEPADYVLSIHITNLILFWSRTEVRAAVYLLENGFKSKNSLLFVRLYQLKATYGYKAFTAALRLSGIDDLNTMKQVG